jgi:beta-glucosidase
MRKSNWLSKTLFFLIGWFFLFPPLYSAEPPVRNPEIEARIDSLIARMTLAEKVGQMCQTAIGRFNTLESVRESVRKGEVGSFLNAGDLSDKNDLQRIAVKESRLGIPLIFGRDVIHGYRTVFPIPLGQSCSWNPDLVEKAARITAVEASSEGVHWTFAPMIDIARDPRWGRIAEGCGEDPFLTSALGAAMVRGFQGRTLSDSASIAACAKHYAGYGACEGGRDYNTAWIPEGLLRDVYLPSFRAAAEAGAATLMSAFNEINGVPASGNEFTLRQVLREEWGFDGFVVSDWESVQEMVDHGFCADRAEAARKAAEAGVDMEMVSECYHDHLADLVRKGVVSEKNVDEAVRNILRIKYRKGLFERPFTESTKEKIFLQSEHLATAKQLAVQSLVLLKNDKNALPISKSIGTIAVIGPMADSPIDQMGCWAPDGRPEDVITPLAAIQLLLGKERVLFAEGLKTSRDMSTSGFAKAVQAVGLADAALVFVGEEEAITGEAKSRAFINLPGMQEELVLQIARTGKPVVLVIMSGRPLTFSTIATKVQAVLYAWHPGTMGGPALADVLFGQTSPSGKLTVTFPRTVGQIPIYYSHKNTGRPPSERSLGIPMGTPLDPLRFNSQYIDVDFTPEYPFGFGLSYTEFKYYDLKLSSLKIGMNDTLAVTARILNAGKRQADEIVQVYVCDLVGSVTRPVKELKGFKRIGMNPGESKTVRFEIKASDLAFWNKDMQFKAEPGMFQLWIGPNSAEGLKGEFELVE